MHRQKLFFSFSLLVVSILAPVQSTAQQPPQRNGIFNPYSVQFERKWNILLPEGVKLIEVGQVSTGKRASLLMLVGGKNVNDFQRHLLVTHWNGSKFYVNEDIEIQGSVLDTLLVGHFRTQKPAAQDKKEKSKTPLPASPNQIITTTGVYEWQGKTFARVMDTPIGAKLTLAMEKTHDRLLTGAGDSAVHYQMGESDMRPLPAFDEPMDSPGYVRFGVGLQEFPGIEAMNLPQGARYAQSIWRNRSKWIIGVERGRSASTQEHPNATTDDRIVVYTPKFSSREKSFWATNIGDLELTFRSEPIPGNILDVRVGDPREEGREGILVLTSENNDKDRRLHFFGVAFGSR